MDIYLSITCMCIFKQCVAKISHLSCSYLIKNFFDSRSNARAHTQSTIKKKEMASFVLFLSKSTIAQLEYQYLFRVDGKSESVIVLILSNSNTTHYHFLKMNSLVIMINSLIVCGSLISQSQLPRCQIIIYLELTEKSETVIVLILSISNTTHQLS